MAELCEGPSISWLNEKLNMQLHIYLLTTGKEETDAMSIVEITGKTDRFL